MDKVVLLFCSAPHAIRISQSSCISRQSHASHAMFPSTSGRDDRRQGVLNLKRRDCPDSGCLSPLTHSLTPSKPTFITPFSCFQSNFCPKLGQDLEPFVGTIPSKTYDQKNTNHPHPATPTWLITRLTFLRPPIPFTPTHTFICPSPPIHSPH